MDMPLPSPYFRRDQERGTTAPDLSKDCDHAEHIVRARGKRTRFTSVSLDQDKIDDFGPALDAMLAQDVLQDNHAIIEHTALMGHLRSAASSKNKGDRLRALQAIRYASRRREGLIDWRFDISSVERKELITWARGRIQKYFRRV